MTWASSESVLRLWKPGSLNSNPGSPAPEPIAAVLAEAAALEAHAGFHQPLTKALFRRDKADRGVDAMVAAREQTQTLRCFVHQFRLRQNAATHGNHGVGSQNVRPAQFVIELHRFQRGIGFRSRQPICAGARQFTAFRRLVDIRGAQRIRLDTGLIEQAETAGRAGSKHEFGTA